MPWRIEYKEPHVDHHGIVMHETNEVLYIRDKVTEEDARREAVRMLPRDCSITRVKDLRDD